MNQIEIKEEKIQFKRYSMYKGKDIIKLTGVLQIFDNTYPGNGRIYDEKVYRKSFRKYLRRIKIMSIFNV